MSSRLTVPVSIICTAFLLVPRALGQPQDTAAGQGVFQAQCSICHSPRPGRTLVGPSLFGVVGRRSGRIPDFHYSSANLRSGLTWDPPTLDRYLASPQQVVPGTLMTYPGLKDPRMRADLIAYLAMLH